MSFNSCLFLTRIQSTCHTLHYTLTKRKNLTHPIYLAPSASPAATRRTRTRRPTRNADVSSRQTRSPPRPRPSVPRPSVVAAAAAAGATVRSRQSAAPAAACTTAPTASTRSRLWLALSNRPSLSAARPPRGGPWTQRTIIIIISVRQVVQSPPRSSSSSSSSQRAPARRGTAADTPACARSSPARLATSTTATRYGEKTSASERVWHRPPTSVRAWPIDIYI